MTIEYAGCGTVEYTSIEVERLDKLVTDRRELLDALKVLFDMVDDQYGNGIANGYWPTVAPRHEQAKQAIAKAEAE